MIEVRIFLSQKQIDKLVEDLESTGEFSLYYQAASIKGGLKEYFHHSSSFYEKILDYFVDAIKPEELINFCDPDLYE